MEYDKILTDILGRKDFLVVGKNVTRTDALDKALGKAKYTADYVPKETTILKVYRSTVAHARIKSIDTSEALKIPTEMSKRDLNYKMKMLMKTCKRGC